MKVINIDSVENIKVVGFDVFYTDSNGTQQTYTDGLIAIAKGELSVMVNGSELDISEVVDAGDNVAESVNNAFLENTIASSKGNTEKKEEESEEEIVDELLEQQKESDEQLEFIQQQLQERLAEIKRLEEELEQQKQESEEELEEDALNLEELLPATSAGEVEEESDASEDEDENAVDAEGLSDAVQSVPQPLPDDPIRPKKGGSPAVGEIDEELEAVFVDVNLSSSSDSGLQGDFITNINNSSAGNSLVFDGTSSEGAKITLVLDGKTYTTTTSVAGTWSITTSGLLTDNTYSVSVTAEGPDGGLAEFNQDLVIDTDPPAAPTDIALTKESDSAKAGAPDDDPTRSDRKTNVVNPTFTGSAEADSTVTLTVNGKDYSGVADESGLWEITVTDDLPDGVYGYSAVAEDAAGNVSDPAFVEEDEGDKNITIDTSNVLTGGLYQNSDSDSGLVGDETTNITNPKFSGTGEAGATVTLEIDVGGDISTYTALVDENGVWVTEPIDALITVGGTPVADDVYEYTLSSEDVAGNETSITQSFTLDTVVSNLTAGLDISSDSGETKGDGLTNDNTPRFSGTSEVGAEITLTIGSAIYTTNVDGDGAWTIDTETAFPEGMTSIVELPEGLNIYSVHARDVAGNERTLDGLSVTIDTTAPALTGGLDSVSDSGALNSDSITNVNEPFFSGTSEAGARIELLIGGQTYDAIANDQGVWDVKVEVTNGLADGNQPYTISAFDAAGNKTDVSGSITIDTLHPLTSRLASDSGSSDTDGITNINTPTITGTSGIFDEITLTISIGDVVVQELEGDANAGGIWSIKIPTSLDDGIYTYTVTSLDLAGNIGSATNTLTVDTAAPSPFTGRLSAASDSGDSNNDGITNDVTPTFTGTVENDDSVVTLIIGGNTYDGSVDTDGNWAITVSDTLIDGDYPYQLTATDLAGNESLINGSVTIDTLAPAFSGGLSDASDNGASDTDNITNNTQPNFSGTGEVGASVTLAIGGKIYTGIINAQGNWDIPVSTVLPEGSNPYTLTATDTAGNATTLTDSIQIDISTVLTGGLSAVSDTGLASDNITLDDTPQFNGTGEAGATVVLAIDGETYSSIVGSDGSWTIQVDEPLSGSLTGLPYAYQITATDIAGNEASVDGLITVDTSTEVAAALTIASDTGASNTDGITNMQTPTFSGTAEAGATIEIDINNEKYTKTANTDGEWSVQVTNALPNGGYSYVVTATDIAGNTAQSTGSIQIDIETNVTIRLDEASDTGASNSDGITDQITPFFSGSGEAGATILLAINGNTYSTTVGAGGAWSVQVTDTLPDSVYSYDVTATDLAGNTETATGSVTIDTSTKLTAALATISDTGLSDDDGITQDTTPTFTGTGEVGAEVVLTIDGETYTSVVGADDTWTITVDDVLVDQVYPYDVTATDTAGNALSVTGSITIDTQAPTFDGGLSDGSDSGLTTDNITNDTQPNFSGTGEVGATVELSIAGQTYSEIVDAGGNWQITVSSVLADGDYPYSLTATDAAGNSTALSDSIEIDTSTTLTGALSTISDTGILGDNITQNNEPQFSGTGEAGATVVLSIDGETYSGVVGSDGNWTLQIDETLADSAHAYQITSTDIAGNQETINGSITVDTNTSVTAALSLDSDTGISKIDGITSVQTPTFSGTAEAGASIELVVNTQTYTGTADVSGTWSIQVTDLLSDESYDYSVTATDVAGNTAQASGSIQIDTDTNVTIRLDAASDTGASNSDGITQQNTPLFSGLGEVDASVVVTINGNSYTTTVGAGGTWSVQVTDDLSDGDYVYDVISTDLAGNTDTGTGSITIDTSTEVTALLVTASDTGIENDDGITQDTTPTFTGTGEVGAAVVLAIGGATYNGVVSADGSWTINVDSPLVDGVYPYQVTATDTAGNQSSVNNSVTVDTQAPVFDGGLIDASDTGVSATDNITNDAQPDFGGTGEAGASVVLSIAGETYSSTVDSAGNWLISVDNAISSGDHPYVLTATDTAGNTTTLSDSIEVDTSTVLTGALSTSSDTGLSNDDEITQDNTPQFNGTGEAGATVVLTIDGKTYSGVVASDETWTIQVDDTLDDSPVGAPYAYQITATDIAGNTATINGDVTVDTTTTVTAALTLASDTGVSKTDGITNEQTPTFSGTAEAGAAIEVEVNNETYTGVADVNGEWAIQVTDSLDDGGYGYSVTATDVAGNTAQSTGTIQIDTDTNVTIRLDAASDTGSSNADGITQNNIPFFSGAGEVGANIEVTINGNTYDTTVGVGGTWSLQVTDTLPDGDHDYSVVATDIAGNIDTATGSVTIDTSITITASLFSGSDTGISDNDAITQETTPTFGGTGKIGAAVVLTIAGNTYNGIVGSDGNWSITIDNALSDGEYSYQVTSSDTAGNEASVSNLVEIDTQAPVFNGGLSDSSDSGLTTDNITNVTQPNFSGTGEVGAAVVLSIAGQLYSGVVDAAGNWEIDVSSTLPVGDQPYTLTATDLAGNSTTLSDSIEIDISTTLTGALSATSDSGLSNSDEITQDNTPQFNGTGEAGATVVLSIDGKAYNSVVDSDGSWTIQIDDTLADTTHTYLITATDIAGNQATVNGAIVVDTSASISAALSLASDSGISNVDGITNVQTPSFSGMADANSSIELVINNQTYTSTANGTGEWSIQVIDTLEQGSYPYAVTATDVAGNTAQSNGSIQIDIDTNVTIRLDAASDTGSSNSDGITQQNTPFFSGVGEVDATINVAINGNTYATTVGAGGTWSLQVTDTLTDSDYNYQVTATDIAGNTNTATGTVTIDSSTTVTAGLLSGSDSGISDTDGITQDTTPTFTGTGEVGAEVDLIIDGETYSSVVGTDGNWTISVDSSLTDGIYPYQVTATDTAGNESTVNSSVEIDTETPVFSGGLSNGSDSGLSSTDNITNDTQPNFSGRGEAGLTVVLSIAGQTYSEVIDAGGNWQITVTAALSDADYPYTLTATDLAGNSSTLSDTVKVDSSTTLTGALSTTSDSGLSNSDEITQDNTPQFSGTGEVGATVVLRLGDKEYSAVVNNDGNWTIQVDDVLADASYVYQITATDIAGNTATVNGDIVVDTSTNVTAALSLASDTGTSSTDGITSVQTPTFSGTAEVGATIEVAVNNETYTGTANASGEWSIQVTDTLADGNYSYGVTATDIAGNTAQSSGNIQIDTDTNVTIRLDAASDTGSSNSDGITQQNTPLFSGIGEVDATINVAINGNTYTTTVGAGGTWSVQVTDTLPDGDHSYDVTATDIAGNTDTGTGTVEIDTTTSVTATLFNGSDSGISDTDGITQDTTPTFTGTGEVGAGIVLVIDGDTYNGTVDADGNWTITADSALTDGIYPYQVTATDTAGNISTVNSSVEVDTQAPVFNGGLSDGSDSGASSSDNITNDTQPNFSGTGEAGATVVLNIAGQTYSGVVDVTGNWTVAVSSELSVGNHPYTLTATDTAGNSTSLNDSVDVDTSTTLTGALSTTSDSGLSNSDQITQDNTPQFNGTGEAGATVVLTIDGKTYSGAVNNDGNWTLQINDTLSDTAHAYQIVSTDIAGNTATVSGAITVDTDTEVTAALSLASDTGTSSTDGITSVQTPTFSGTAEAGAVIQVDVNNETYTGTANASGEWSIQVTDTLADGSYSYGVTATDVAGNTAQSSGNIQIDTDTNVTIRLDAASDTGSSNSDGITQQNTPLFSGIGEVDATINVAINGNTYTTTVGAGGTWSVQVTDTLPDGDHSYDVTATDIAGNTDTGTGTISIDTSTSVTATLFNGSDSGISDTDGITQDTTPTFTGTGEVGAGIVLVIDGDTYNGTVDADGNWTITADSALTDGIYPYQVTATDTAGNISTVNSSVEVDTQAPVFNGGLSDGSDSGTSSSDNITNDTQPNFSGTGEAGDAVVLNIAGQTYTGIVDVTGSWTVAVSSVLPAGNHTYTLTATDTAGNSTALSDSINVDTSTTLTGALSTTSDSGLSNSDQITQDNTPQFNGTGEAGATVVLTIDGKTYSGAVDNDGNWTLQINDTLSDTAHAYQIVSTDIAGNTATVNGDIVVDTATEVTAALSLASDTGTSSTDGITSVQTPTFSGTAEAGATIEVAVNNETYTGTANASGEWSIQVTDSLGDGSYSYSVTATDIAGNTAQSGGNIQIDTDTNVTIRLDAASDTGSSNSDGITQQNTPLFSGIGEVDATINVAINGNTYTTTVGAGGTWSVQVTDTLPDGDHSYDVTATDIAGNTDTGTGTVKIDTTTSVTATLFNGSDSGISDTDGITQDTTPTFTGTGEVGAGIALIIDGDTYSGTVGTDGNWTITADSALVDGIYPYQVTATDTAGNISTVNSSVEVDTQAPVFNGGLSDGSDSGTSSSDNITNDTQPNFSGTGEAGAAVVLNIAGQTYTGVVDVTGSWSVSVANELADATHNYQLTATDIAGNDTSLFGSIEVDTVSNLTASLAAASDTGDLNTDGITRVQDPVFSGTAEAGASVEFVINNQTYDVTADNDGLWTVQVNTPLDDGSYSYGVTSIDVAGNSSQSSGLVVIDTVTNVTARLDAVSDSGISDSDTITNVAAPTFSGTGEEGARIVLTIDGQSYSTTVNNNDIWSLTLPSPLDSADYNYSVTTTDIAGNTDVADGTITIDAISPPLTGGLDVTSDSGVVGDNVTNDITPTFSGTGENGNTVTLSIGSVNYTAIVANGLWSVATNELAPDSYDYTITAEDTAGNTTERSGSIVVDNDTFVTADLLTASDSGYDNDDNITNVQQPTIAGTGEAGATIDLVIGTNSYTTTVLENGTWSIATTTPLIDGAYPYTVTATDVSGNTATVNDSILIDTINPPNTGRLAEQSDSGRSDTDQITNVTTPIFAGSTDANVFVRFTIGGLTYQTTSNSVGDWQITLPESSTLTAGTYNYSIVTEDYAGNISDEYTDSVEIDVSTTVSIRIDALSDTGLSNSDSITQSPTPILSGSGEVGADISVSISGEDTVYTTTVNNDGTWSIASTLLEDGSYTANVLSTDIAGNTRADSVSFVIDTEALAPTVSLDSDSDSGASDSDGVTNSILPSFSGTAEAGSQVTFSINGQDRSTTADNSGNWTLQLGVALPEGDHEYEVSYTDIAGNVSPTITGNVTIDTTPIVLENIILKDNLGAELSDWGTNTTAGFTFEGQTAANGTVTINMSGQAPVTVVADTTGFFSYVLPELSESNYTVNFSVPDDLAGNSNSFTNTLIVDKSISLTGELADLYDSGLSQDDNITNINTPLLTGNTDPESTVTIRIGGNVVGTVTADVTGFWEYLYTTPLADGTHPYIISAVDIYGNSTEASGQNVVGQLVIDTSAPIFSGQLSETTDSGVVGDKITQDTALTYNGAGETGATVTLEIAGETFTTTVIAGVWSITTTDLPLGEHAVEMTISDVAGNEREISDNVTIQASTLPLSVDLRESSDSATIGDGITSDNTPFLDGIVTPTASVTVVVKDSDGVTVGTYNTTSDTFGAWSVQLIPTAGGVLADDNYSYSVDTQLEDENQSINDINLVIDTEVSVFTHGLSVDTDTGVAADNITKASIPEIKGVTDPGSSVVIAINGEEYSVVANAQGNYSLAIPSLGNGEYQYTITATDTAGNVAGYVAGGDEEDNAAATATITVDRQAPVLTAQLATASDTGISSTDGITSDNTPTVVGTITGEFSQVYLTLNLIQYAITPDVDGNWSITLPELTDGFHNYQVYAADIAGNEVTVQNSLQIKTGIEFTTRLENDTGIRDDDFLTNDNTLSFVGATEPDNDIVASLYNESNTLLDQVTVTAGASGAYTVDFPDTLTDGLYNVRFAVSDDAGNSYTLREDVTVDTSSQAANYALGSASDSGDNITDGITNDINPIFIGTGEAGATVSITLLNASGGTVTTLSTIIGTDGELSFAFNNVAEGAYTIKAEVTDQAGNTTTPADYAFEIITTAPNLTWSIQEDTDNSGIINETEYTDGTMTFLGTGDTGDTITLLISGEEHTSTVDADGNWQIVTPKLPDFDYVFQITAEDVAGNTTIVNDNIILDAGLELSFWLTTASDTFYNLDNYTADVDPTFGFVTDIGSTITITVTGANTGYSHTETFTATSTQFTWQAPDTFADDTYSFSINAIDQALNTRSVTQTVTIDTTIGAQPDINVSGGPVDADGVHLTRWTTPTFTGSVASDINRVKITVDGKSETDFDVSSGTFSIPISISEGQHTYTIVYTDRAGNTHTETGEVDVKSGFDSSPTVAIADFNEIGGVQYGHPDNLVLNGTGDVGVNVTVTIDGEQFTTQIDADGNWTLDLSDQSFPDDVYPINTYFTDAYTNWIRTHDTLLVDSVAPELSVEVIGNDFDPSNDVLLNQDSATLQGETGGRDTININVNGVISPATVDSDGKWSFDLSGLNEGANTIVVTSTDRAGNETTVEQNISVDTITTGDGDLTAASDTGASSSDGITSDTLPTFSGTGEVGATVTLSISGQVPITTVVNSSGNWSIDVSTPLAAGTYTYNIGIEDAIGNTATIVNNGDLVIDDQISGNGGLDSASDTGSSSNDGITRDSTPTFSGTGEVGATVTLLINGLAPLTAIVGVTGVWSIDVITPLSEPAYTYDITIEDVAGNTSDIISNGNLVIDNQVSGAGALEAASDTGSSTNDAITSDNRPTFSGTGEVGATVTLSISGQSALTTHVDSSGNWTIDVTSPLSSGSYTYDIQIEDVAGNTSAIVTDGSLQIDTQVLGNGDLEAASDTGSSNSDGITSDTRPTFSGVGEVGATVTLSISGQSALTTLVDSSGNWTIDVTSPLSSGSYTYDIQIEDVAGNTSAIVTDGSLQIDTQVLGNGDLEAASDTGSSNSDGITSDTRPTFSGVGEVGATVTLSISGQSALTTLVDSSGNWTIDVTSPLSSGSYTYDIQIEDIAGNTSPIVTDGSLQIDTQVLGNGDLEASSDSGISDSDYITKDTSPTFAGTGEIGATVTMNIDGVSESFSSTVDTNGEWSIDVSPPLSPAIYTYEIVIEDPAGNTADIVNNGRLVIDTTAPSFTGISDFTTSDTTPLFSGHIDALEEGASVSVTLEGETYAGEVDENGDWSIEATSSVGAGNHNYDVTVVDIAGNSITEEHTLTII